MTDHHRASRDAQGGLAGAVKARLARALTLEDVVATLTDSEGLGARSLAIHLPGQKGLRRYATTEPDCGLTLDNGYLQWHERFPMTDAFTHRTPLFLSKEDIRRAYPLFWPYVADAELDYGAFLPLIAHTKPIGVLSMAWREKGDYSPDQLLGLTPAIAKAVKRASLYDWEHEVTTALRESIMPVCLPEVKGVRVSARYRSAFRGSLIGGDWYDVFPLSGDRIGLAIGDVQGHDVRATTVMGQMRTALRAYALQGSTPDAVMADLDVFLTDLDTDRFVTCLYAELDVTTGRASVVLAGHHGPLLRHSDGTTSCPGVRGGLPLGLPISDRPGYPVNEIRLRRGDMLLLSTDGLPQFYDTDLTQGFRRVEDLLGSGTGDPDRLADRMIHLFDEAHGLEDDASFLLVTRTHGE